MVDCCKAVKDVKIVVQYFFFVPPQTLLCISSPGGLKVESNGLIMELSISVDQSQLGAHMIIWYQWTHYVMYVLDVCYITVVYSGAYQSYTLAGPPVL